MSAVKCSVTFGKVNRPNFRSYVTHWQSPVAIPAKGQGECRGNRVAGRRSTGQAGILPSQAHGCRGSPEASFVTRTGETAEARAMHGLARAIIQNMVKGVTDGFVKKLEIQGVGFKAAVQGTLSTCPLASAIPFFIPSPPASR